MRPGGYCYVEMNASRRLIPASGYLVTLGLDTFASRHRPTHFAKAAPFRTGVSNLSYEFNEKASQRKSRVHPMDNSHTTFDSHA
jgi:hypothetical protein